MLMQKEFLAALLVWLSVSLALALAALVIVIVHANAGTDAAFDRAHLAGMELGQQMCLGLRSELERAPAPQPAARPLGGLL